MTYTDDTKRGDSPPTSLFFLLFDLKPKRHKDSNFSNEIKDLGVDLSVVVDIVVIAVISLNPQTESPNPPDLLNAIKAYSVVVDIVVEFVVIDIVEALKGPKKSNNINDLHRATEPVYGGGMVAEPWSAVNIS